ncbi:kinase-like domain-containing protein [Trichophaea hybrida]|nr:kinase-like domain-containing protein [Trichophaea hybrida]
MPDLQDFQNHAHDTNCKSISIYYKFQDMRNGARRKKADETSFYSPTGIKRILRTHAAEVQDTLRCRCSSCIELHNNEPNPNDTNIDIFTGPEWQVTLFAVLVHMGTSFMFSKLRTENMGERLLLPNQRRNDLNLMRRLLAPYDNFRLEEGIASFWYHFDVVKEQYNPPVLGLNSLFRTFQKHTVFPFVNEKQIDRGSVGSVYAFDLEEEFQDAELKSKRYNHSYNNNYLKLARKQLDPNYTSRHPSEFENEKKIVEFVSKLQHPNIVPLCFWYEHLNSHNDNASTYNLVFPFYDGNLLKIIRENWHPPGKSGQQGEAVKFLSTHWLWKQMIEVTSALAQIHNPNSALVPLMTGSGSTWICGHFDIKPDNILVGRDGQLIIADFGHSALKEIHYSSGSDLPGGRGADEYRPPPAESKDRNWDIWSLACVMIEVIIFIFDGYEQVKRFAQERGEDDEDRGEKFWRSLGDLKVLKPCVQRRLTLWLSSDDRYLKKVAENLQRMLRFVPKERPKIQECVKELALPEASINCMIVPEERRRVGEVELCCPQGRVGRTRWLRTIEVRFSDKDSPDSTTDRECRLQLFENNDTGTIRIATHFISNERLKTEIETEQLLHRPTYIDRFFSPFHEQSSPEEAI